MWKKRQSSKSNFVDKRTIGKYFNRLRTNFLTVKEPSYVRGGRAVCSAGDGRILAVQGGLVSGGLDQDRG